MSNINLAGDRFFSSYEPTEPAKIVGTGETYANVGDVPDTLKYPGKRIYDKDNSLLYQISSDGTTAEVQKKVDQVEGKGLSENNYTTTEKNKVSNVPSNTNEALGNKVGIVENSLTGIYVLTQAEYDALIPDENTLYIVKEE